MEFSELSIKWSEKVYSPIQRIDLPVFEKKKINVFVKREDLNNPIISGNKLRKLKYNILKAAELDHTTLLTFGGAFSNHIVATACAGYESGFNTIGVIRGNELETQLPSLLKTNKTLQQAHDFGMKFQFISREAYRKKEEVSFLKDLENQFGLFYCIPEGGSNYLAVKGTSEILLDDNETQSFDYIASSVGTGGTISGLIEGAGIRQKVLGFSALKDGSFLNENIRRFTTKKNYKLIVDYHFGGYAKYNDELIRFINDVKKQTSIPLDPIYTGKMFYGLVDLIKKDYFEENSSILMIHSGGLQGIDGINKRLKKKNQILINT